MFHYKLRTLMIAIAWAALIYRTGPARAMAVGFLVFTLSYLSYHALLSGTLRFGQGYATAIGTAFGELYVIIHPDIVDTHTKADGTVESVVRERVYDYPLFISICHYTAACLFGVVGSIAAQLLQATAKKKPEP